MVFLAHRLQTEWRFISRIFNCHGDFSAVEWTTLDTRRIQGISQEHHCVICGGVIRDWIASELLLETRHPGIHFRTRVECERCGVVVAQCGIAGRLQGPWHIQGNGSQIDLETGVANGPEQQNHVIESVAGHDDFRTGTLDLLHVRGEILNLVQVMNHITGDIYVSGLQDVALCSLHAESIRVVLIDQKGFRLENSLRLQNRDRQVPSHFRRVAGTEKPEMALLACQIRRGRAYVVENDFLSRVAQVVAPDFIGQLACHGGGCGLKDHPGTISDCQAKLLRSTGQSARIIVVLDHDRVAVVATASIDLFKRQTGGLRKRASNRFRRTGKGFDNRYFQ